MDEVKLLEYWEGRGVKFKVDDFYHYCRSHGLLSHVQRDAFRDHFYRILALGFVEGIATLAPGHTPPTVFGKASG